jgi:hypothetical protein
MDIKVYDNFLGKEKQKQVLNFLETLTYQHGEQDREDTPPIGQTCDLVNNELDLPASIQKKLGRNISDVRRFYVNRYQAKELPYWHDDGECTTFLYYPCNVDNIDEGGETQFLLDNRILAVPYKPDRLIEFNGRIPHKATGFRSYERYTIAVKYRENNWLYDNE